MKKNEKILLGVLGAAVIYFVVDLFFLGGEGEPDKPEVQVTARQDRQAPSPAVTPKTKSASLNIQLLKSWKRDPFLGAFSPALIDSMQGNVPYVLKAIAWRGKTAHVLINDDIFKLGVRKKGSLVSEVRDSSVVFLTGSQRYILKLGDTHE